MRYSAGARILSRTHSRRNPFLRPFHVAIVTNHGALPCRTVLDWVPVFLDERYILPAIDSLQFTRRQKGLKLYAYVVMPNHLHLIVSSSDLHSHIRDFKRFTSRQIHERLVADGRQAILRWLNDAAQSARRKAGAFSLWQHGFHPKVIRNRSVFEQKLKYLHENPTRKGLVANPQAWRFSSAGYFAGDGECVLEMDPIEM